ncbi:MAG: DUF4395 family protein [Candidatus Dormibacteraeota bacterium]|nr:DUF4395 family protein [Candidatus Dormibacteraeota bacterium]
MAELFDVTARKVHQWTMAVLIAAGFLLGDRFGPVLVLVAGVVMLAGRFWWPADVVRQFTWRVLEPRHVLRRRERAEDHTTRRIARTVGGGVWIAAAVLVWVGLPLVGWPLALLIALMVVLDAALDFCVLCFAFLHLDRAGLLPASLRHS